MNKQQLANKIWASANKMRSKIEANEYKDYILGLIFYKFLSDNEVNYLKSIGWTDEDIVTLVENHEDQEAIMMMEYCRNNIGYFIEYKNLFGTWLKPNSEFSVADLSGALNSFDRLISPHYKHVYENIFKTLQAGLSKLGENTASQTRALKNLIKLIKDIPTDGSQDYDVLGYVYEYLISNFAANAGKKAGEFYTPHEVAILMSEIVAEHHKDKDKIEIYDPTSGSGSLLITIGKSVGRHIEDKNKVKNGHWKNFVRPMKMTNQKLETALELALSVPSSVRAKSPSLETGYSPETQSWELIIRYSGDLVLPEDVTLVSLFGGYGILYLPENRSF